MKRKNLKKACEVGVSVYDEEGCSIVNFTDILWAAFLPLNLQGWATIFTRGPFQALSRGPDSSQI